jgi:2-phospho-L-lactate guanylyltransferase (CobY/MobA/RfbA family)
MLGAFLKKKITHKQFAKLMVRLIIDATDGGFPDVAMLINDDKCFVKNPKIDPKDDGKFLLIVVAGNLKALENKFDSTTYQDFFKHVAAELALVYQFTEEQMLETLKEYKSFMARVNHPSKNIVYALSKGLFFKYNLVAFQDDYFRGMNCPNPLFVKRLDEVMEKFLLDTAAFFKKYRFEA